METQFRKKKILFKYPLETKFVLYCQASKGCELLNGMPVVGRIRGNSVWVNCPDKLRKMTPAMVEGWQLAASRMGVHSGFGGLKNGGIKITVNV